MGCPSTWTVVVLLAAAVLPAGSAGSLRMVALLTCPAVDPEHRLWATSLLAELANQGHEVDVVDLPQDSKKLQALQERASWSYRNASAVQQLRDAYQLGAALSESQVPQLRHLLALQHPADVLLAEYCLNDATLLVAGHLLRDPSLGRRPALVVLAPEAAPPPWTLRAVGALSPLPPALPFLQRLSALALVILDHHRYHWRHRPAQCSLAAALQSHGQNHQELDCDLTAAAVLANQLAGVEHDAVRAARVHQVAWVSDVPRDELTKTWAGAQAGPWLAVQLGELALPYLDGVLRELSALRPVRVLLAVQGVRDHLWQQEDSHWKKVAWVEVSAVLKHLKGPGVAMWIGAPALARAAVAAGVPQVGVPLTREEQELADGLTRSGVVTQVSVADLVTPGTLVRTVEQVFSDPEMLGAARDLMTVVKQDDSQTSPLRRAVRVVELVPALARLPRPAGRPLHQLLQLDVLAALALLSLLAVAAASSFAAFLLTLLCYRKKVRTKPKKL